MIINFYMLMIRSMPSKIKLIGQSKPLLTHVDLRALQGKGMKWWQYYISGCELFVLIFCFTCYIFFFNFIGKRVWSQGQ